MNHLMRSLWRSSVAFALTSASAAAAAPSAPPDLVAVYTAQLVKQCGPAATGAGQQLVQRVDLNGDGRPDWVVDAGRYPCPARPAALNGVGQQVTVFLDDGAGRPLPAFQRLAFGARVEGKPGAYALWLTLGGADCEPAAGSAARCERKVTWSTRTRRLELEAVTPPAVRPPTPR